MGTSRSGSKKSPPSRTSGSRQTSLSSFFTTHSPSAGPSSSRQQGASRTSAVVLSDSDDDAVKTQVPVKKATKLKPTTTDTARVGFAKAKKVKGEATRAKKAKVEAARGKKEKGEKAKGKKAKAEKAKGEKAKGKVDTYKPQANQGTVQPVARLFWGLDLWKMVIEKSDPGVLPTIAKVSKTLRTLVGMYGDEGNVTGMPANNQVPEDLSQVSSFFFIGLTSRTAWSSAH